MERLEVDARAPAYILRVVEGRKEKVRERRNAVLEISIFRDDENNFAFLA